MNYLSQGPMFHAMNYHVKDLSFTLGLPQPVFHGVDYHSQGALFLAVDYHGQGPMLHSADDHSQI